MIIKSAHVKNFRCILDCTLNCQPLTAIVGPNGAGKSSFLRALELFYAVNPRFSQEDFYNEDTEHDIEIGITFTDLEEEEADQFAHYADGDDLTITRVLSNREGKQSAKFYGSRLQNPAFISVRVSGSATAVTQRYKELRQKPEYAELPVARSQSAALEAMKQWEHDHPEACLRQRDEGQFFGFTEVGQGYLGRFTRLISIPAVRDAAEDAVEGRGRSITEILDMVIRATLANREELKGLREEAQERYDRLMAEGAAKELHELQGRLTSTLITYVPDAEVQLQWITEGGVELSLPKADVKLVEHGFSAAVGRTGHGLQRAFIMTMLQHLATAQSQSRSADQREATTVSEEQEPLQSPMASLVLTIEEPELYQHPSRQRHFANVLLKLASGAVPGVAKRTQVIYSTHSPLFVGIDRFDQIRVVRKTTSGANLPKIARVVEVKGDLIAEELWEACDGKNRNGKSVPKFSWGTLKPRLQAIMTPWMSEGFFADVVVLVEGEHDRAAILGAALAEGHDFETTGISVIPCGGKSCLDRPALIFKKFQIPTYVIWDSDCDDSKALPRANHILLRLVDEDASDWPDGVCERSACFKSNLENTVRNELGPERFDSLMEKLQQQFGYERKDDATKNPHVFRQLVERAQEDGAISPKLRSIVAAITELKQPTGVTT
ncbi:MAG: ATP-dependent endonuclease [Chloroflexi bacterium]|nr:ATP-dependent endonuclease [Chloroflexota bacterium]